LLASGFPRPEGLGSQAVSPITIFGATGMASPILLESQASLFPLFPPVDKFAEENNPHYQDCLYEVLHGPPPVYLGLLM
jgi:hypothetical protein